MKKSMTRLWGQSRGITPFSQELKELMREAGRLRDEGKYDEATRVIEDKLPEMATPCLFNAYYTIFNINVVAGNVKKAKQYAELLWEFEPELPAIQSYLNLGDKKEDGSR